MDQAGPQGLQIVPHRPIRLAYVILLKITPKAALEALVSIARNGASEAAIAFPHDWPVWG